MIQTYQGHFQEDGRFVVNNKIIKMPINRPAIVNILDAEIQQTVKNLSKSELLRRAKNLETGKGVFLTDEEFERQSEDK